jgi:NAD(P)-dependent dehydrogenase (short-subunit alcohol dehydrogenase family)
MSDVAHPMHGKFCLVMGATSGIGLVTAEALARQGATTALVARNPTRGAAMVERIRQATGNPAVEMLLADLSAQAEIRRLAREVQRRYPRLDVLVNNAGALFARRALSADGIEMTWALNHLAYVLLTTLLLDTLKAGAPARVVNVSSDALAMPRSISTTCRESNATAAGGPTPNPSWPTCCSPMNWPGSWRAPASPPTPCTRASWPRTSLARTEVSQPSCSEQCSRLLPSAPSRGPRR